MAHGPGTRWKARAAHTNLLCYLSLNYARVLCPPPQLGEIFRMGRRGSVVWATGLAPMLRGGLSRPYTPSLRVICSTGLGGAV